MRREIRRRFPAFTPQDGTVALYETEAGVVFPEEAIRAHLDVAADNGAQLHFDERVEGWQVSPSGTIEVRTARARYEAGRLILAPGAWASSLFKIDWLPLEVEPQQLHWFLPRRRRGGVRAGSIPDLHLGSRRRRSVLRLPSGGRWPRQGGVLSIQGDRGERRSAKRSGPRYRRLRTGRW